MRRGRLPARRGAFATALALGAMLSLGGCASDQAGYTPKWYVEPVKAMPTYAEVAGRYNARIKGLEKLRFPANLVIDSPGEEDGARRTNQVEANVQFVAPRQIALRVDKVSNTLAYLGCDETRYWWLDLDAKRALVGEHAKATPRSASRFGIPVHPLDLIDLLGVTGLPGAGATATWNEDQTLWVVTLPARGKGWGERTIAIDPDTAEPQRIEIFEASGELAASAELSRFVPVAVRGEVLSKARIASRFEVEVPATDSTIVVSVSQPENPAERMRAAPFDLPLLLKSYGIKDVVDVDKAAASK